MAHVEFGCHRTLSYRFVIYEEERLKWKELLAVLGNASPFAKGVEPDKVRIDDVLCAIMLKASAVVVNPRSKNVAFWFAYLVGLGFALLPSALRILTGFSPLGSTWFSTSMVLSSAVLVSIWWRADVLFLAASWMALQRVAVMRNMICALLCDNSKFVTGRDNERVRDWPTLRVTDPSVVRVFNLLWKLHISYGRAYWLRLNSYNFFSYTIWVVFAAYLAGVIFENEIHDVDVDLKTLLPVNLLIGVMMLFSLIFTLMMGAGSAANETVQELELHLMEAIGHCFVKMEVLQHSELAIPPDTDEYREVVNELRLVEQSAQLLKHTQELIAKLHEHNPVRVIGLRANISLIFTFASIILTGAFFLGDRVYGLTIVPYLGEFLSH